MDEWGVQDDTVAYVLIKAELGAAATVAQRVSVLEGVLWADTVTGPYDVIAAVTVPNNRELGDLVIERIQVISGVKNPLTAVLSSHYKQGERLPRGRAGFP